MFALAYHSDLTKNVFVDLMSLRNLQFAEWVEMHSQWTKLLNAIVVD